MEPRRFRVGLRLDRTVQFTLRDRSSAEGRLELYLVGAVRARGVPTQLHIGSSGLLRLGVWPQASGLAVVFDVEPAVNVRASMHRDAELTVHVEGPTTEPPPARVRRMVVDPGHGGADYGARAFGRKESRLALDLARRVRRALAQKAPRLEVILTREDDTFVSLEQRSSMANAVDADAFVSIHLNGLDEEVRRGGVTTFVLDTRNDRQARRLAALENGTTLSEVSELASLLAKLHRKGQAERSRALARAIQRSTVVAARSILPTIHSRGVKSATFRVLVGARMPAVLVEASFLTYRPEAEALARPAYREALARGIAQGVLKWMAAPDDKVAPVGADSNTAVAHDSGGHETIDSVGPTRSGTSVNL